MTRKVTFLLPSSGPPIAFFSGDRLNWASNPSKRAQMTPEQKSRQQIDRQLEQVGWIVQDYRQMNISARLGVAVREFPLTTGYADYMLYADAKAIGGSKLSPRATHSPASKPSPANIWMACRRHCRDTVCRSRLHTNRPAKSPSSRTLWSRTLEVVGSSLFIARRN